jgi:hypothetical protein
VLKEAKFFALFGFLGKLFIGPQKAIFSSY